MPTAEQYQAKVSAYFLVTLGRPASSDELAAYSQVLADNNGSVWKPSGASLVSYLTPLLEAATAGKNNGQIVTEMFERMTGSQPSMDLYNYYVGLLNQGTIKLKGLANAMLNDLKLMPNVDGGFDQPANWPIDLSGQLTSAQRDAMIAKTGVAVEFTKQLDTVDENNAFKNDPSLAVQLLAGVTDDTTAQAAKDQIDETIQDIVSGGSAGQTFTLTAASGQVEEGTALSFTVKAAQKVDADTTFTVTITGDDNGGTLSKASAADFPADVVSSVTIKAGSDSATFDLTPVANDGTEGLEGFRVTLLDSSNKTVANSGVVAIKDGETDTTAPVVDANQAFTYDENQAEGFVVGTVKASDVGVGGAAGTIATFEIVGGNDDGFFAIDKDGKITLTEAGADKTKAANDFETTPNTFTLKVRAIDAAGNKSADTDVTLTVTDVDDTGPKFVSAAASGTQVKINFDEALKVVALSNPSALFTVTQGGTSYSVNTATISGNTVTLTLASALGSGDTYIAYDGTVLEDAVGNKADKIASTKVTSTDTTPPTLSSSNPADDATDFAANANLTLTFNEDVKLGIGTITLVNTSDATDTRDINVQDSAQVSVSGNTVTINPTADLKENASYAVNISATAILDSTGNAFAGISDNTTLNFTTTPPSTPGQTFTLTKDIDTLTGTSGNDTFIGDNGTAAAADSVSGGAGTDTLKLYDTVTLPTISGIEALYLNSPDGDMDISSKSEITSLTVENQGTEDNNDFTIASGQAVTLKSITEGAAGEDLNILSAADVTTVGLTVDTVGTSTTDVDVDIVGTGVTTLNLTASGAASYFSLVNTGAAIATINIAGDKIATINLDDDSDGGPITSNATTIAVTNTAGAVVTTDDDAAKNVTFTGGAGNDTIYFGTAFDGSDSATGGDGTDTIGIADGADLTQSSGAKATGFEALEIKGGTGTYDMDYLSGITSVKVSGALTANTIVKDMSTSTSVTIGADIGAFSLTLQQKDAGAGSPDDTLTINVDKSTAINSNDVSSVVVDDIETLTVNSTSSGSSITHNIDLLQADETTKLVLNASTAGLQIDGLTAAAMVLLEATSSSKAVDVTVSAISFTSASGVAFKGGAGSDTFDTTNVIDFSATNHDMGGTPPTYADVVFQGGAAGDVFKIDATVDSEQFTFKYVAGDSISKAGATNGFDTTVTDTIQTVVNNAAYADAAGNRIVIDTEVAAIAATKSGTAVVLGTTTVTNAGDFYLDYSGGATAYLYQDTDGDKVLEAGEFAVKIVGAADDWSDEVLSISSGNLVIVTA